MRLRRSGGRLLAALTLLATSLGGPAAPAASAQVTVSDTTHVVTFRDLTFTLPGAGWQRITPQNQNSRNVTYVQFALDGPQHAQVLDVSIGWTTTTLTPKELVARSFDEMKQPLPDGRVENLKTLSRSIAGTAYDGYSWRTVPTAGSPVADGVMFFIFPPDFAERRRYEGVWWVDTHSATIDPLAPDALDQLVASLQTRPLGTVLYADDFSDPDAGRLPKASDDPDTHTEGYVDGEYQVQKLDSDAEGYYAVRAPSTYADTVTSVDVRLATDDPGQEVILDCRGSGSGDSQTHYTFFMLPVEGTFWLSRRDPDGWTTLVARRASDAIQQGTASNHVDLTCSNSRIAVAINGAPVASVYDSTYGEGRVALGAGGGKGTSADVRFSNLRITQA